MRTLTLVYALVLTSPVLATSAVAQAPVRAAAFAPLRASPALPGAPNQQLRLALSRADSSQVRPTYWLEGGLVAAGIVGVLGAVAGHNLCDHGNCLGATVAFSVLGMMVAFPAGALVGGQFPKDSSTPAGPPSH